MPVTALARTVNQLWPQARAMALRRCGRTLRRLDRGDGGLYTGEDLLQDLFVEFHHTVRRWLSDGGNRDDPEPLWELWRSVLWGGARRIIRRKPQRLWEPREEPVDPAVLALDTSPGADNSRPLAQHVMDELMELPGNRSTNEEDAFHEAWDDLPPADRRILYMRVVMGYSGARIFRELGLRDANAAYYRIYAARNRLRQRLSGGHAARCAVKKEKSS